MRYQERIARDVGKLGTPIFPVWTPQRSSSRERRAQSAPRRETPTNRTVPRVGSIISTSVAYWRRSRSHCSHKQLLRLLKQESHDKGLHYSSLACGASLPRIPTRILNTPIIFSSYVSVS